jgi:hypothetical protein
MPSSLPSTSEHVPSTRKVVPNDRRSATVRRISSFTAAGDRIVNNGIRRKRISFADKAEEVGEVPSRSELSEHEFRNLWYTKEDFKSFKTTFLPTLKKMTKNLPLSEDEEPRGLERSTPRGSRSRTDNRYQAMDAVLDEQERQWEQDRKDPLYLAKLYRQSSAHCQMNAYVVAQKDAEYVEQLWEQDAEQQKDTIEPIVFKGTGTRLFGYDTTEEEALSCEEHQDKMESSISTGTHKRGLGYNTNSSSDRESNRKKEGTLLTLKTTKDGAKPTKTLHSAAIMPACGRFAMEVLAQ